jgi:hypothetical protein
LYLGCQAVWTIVQAFAYTFPHVLLLTPTVIVAYGTVAMLLLTTAYVNVMFVQLKPRSTMRGSGFIPTLRQTSAST